MDNFARKIETKEKNCSSVMRDSFLQIWDISKWKKKNCTKISEDILKQSNVGQKGRIESLKKISRKKSKKTGNLDLIENKAHSAASN